MGSRAQRGLVPLLALAGLVAATSACEEERPGGPCVPDGYCDWQAGETMESCPADCPQCNNDGCCDPGESCVYCPADCCMPFAYECLCPLGIERDFLVAELRVPESPEEAASIGVDLDGDGVPDNALGRILARLREVVEVSWQDEVEGAITQGALLLVVRDCIETFLDDDLVAQLFVGAVVGDATPVFLGEDVVSLPESTDFFLYGRLQQRVLEAGPSSVWLSLELEGGLRLELTLSRVQLVGPVDEAGWHGVQLGGGISVQEAEVNLFPALASWLDGKLTSDASSEAARFARESLDGQCRASVPGCDPLPAGCALDGAITPEELRCNALVDELLQPDVDIDGDGERDLVSVGVEIVRTVPVTVVSP